MIESNPDNHPGRAECETEHPISALLRTYLKRYDFAAAQELEIVERLTANIDRHDVSLVIVAHAVRSLPLYLHMLEKFGRVTGVILKPNSRQPNILRMLESRVHILPFTRSSLQTKRGLANFLDLCPKDRSTILMDIGGYFATIASSEAALERRIVGVVEDTENGHQRYESVPLTIPVISVARSRSKLTEDWSVGKAIIFSAEAALRRIGQTFLGRKIVVLGFGKIGTSIALNLQRRGYDIAVFDKDESKLTIAKSMGLHILNRWLALRNSDIIFAATGQASISVDDLDTLRDRALVFSATSADDEFRIPGARLVTSANNFTTIRKTNGCDLYFYNSGNAANFVDGAEVGAFIHLVQATMLKGAELLLQGHCAPRSISEIPHVLERDIMARFIRAMEFLERSR